MKNTRRRVASHSQGISEDPEATIGTSSSPKISQKKKTPSEQSISLKPFPLRRPLKRSVKFVQPEFVPLPRDEYIYCTDCRAFCRSGCSTHSLSLAAVDGLTYRKYSSGNRRGFNGGVFNGGRESIPKDCVLGPYPGKYSHRNNFKINQVSNYVWEVLDQALTNAMGFMDPGPHPCPSKHKLPFVNFCDHKANLVPMQYKKRIFYRVCEDIAPGVELLLSSKSCFYTRSSKIKWSGIRLDSSYIICQEAPKSINNSERQKNLPLSEQRNLQENHPDSPSEVNPNIEKNKKTKNGKKNISDIPYQCHICTRIFGKVSHLYRHLRTVHGHVDPYKITRSENGKSKEMITCRLCSTSFVRSVGLERHLAYIHNVSNPGVTSNDKYIKNCPQCKLPFSKRRNLLLHIEKCHKNGYTQKPAKDNSTECLHDDNASTASNSSLGESTTKVVSFISNNNLDDNIVDDPALYQNLLDEGPVNSPNHLPSLLDEGPVNSATIDESLLEKGPVNIPNHLPSLLDVSPVNSPNHLPSLLDGSPVNSPTHDRSLLDRSPINSPTHDRSLLDQGLVDSPTHDQSLLDTMDKSEEGFESLLRIATAIISDDCIRSLGTSLVRRSEDHECNNADESSQRICERFSSVSSMETTSSIQSYNGSNISQITAMTSESTKGSSPLEPQYLKDQINRVLEQLRDVNCSLCSLSFVCRKELEDHFQSVHGRPNINHCSRCSLTFDTEVELALHIQRVHVMFAREKCKYCSLAFTSEGELEAHMKGVHSGPFS